MPQPFRLLVLALIALGAALDRPADAQDQRRARPVSFKAADEFTIFGDWYGIPKVSAGPILVLLHDASSSAEEYREIATKLRRKGYESLAVDLRVGDSGRKHGSRTAFDANRLLQNVKRSDAALDVVAALEWARFEHPGRQLVVVGCSFSCGLALSAAAERPELVDAVIAFSAGEYDFARDGLSETYVQDAAGKVACPVLFISRRDEEPDWDAIADAMGEGLARRWFPEGDGVHGARSLERDAPGSAATWDVVLGFLEDALGEVATESRLARIAVIGASLSDGFGVGTGFADVLDATIEAEGSTIESKTSGFMFMSPAEHLPEMLALAEEEDATLVVGVDLLFWFGYGSQCADGTSIDPANEVEQRVALLEYALAILEEIHAPLVLGDFPNMQQAVGKMLMPAQMPSAESLAALNATLEGWAEDRENVLLLSLAELHGKLSSGEAFALGRHRWPEGSRDRLLQPDQLHPTLEGEAAVAHVLALRLVEEGWCEEADVQLDLAVVLDRLGEVFVDGE